MDTATVIENRSIVPLALVEDFRPRPTIALIKLLTEPELAEAAMKIHEKYGAAFTAFLLGEASLDELTVEKLEEAFTGAHMASYRDWEAARSSIIEMVMEQVDARSATDARFKDTFETDPEDFFKEFCSNLRIVRIGTGIFIFINRHSLRDLKQ